MANSDFLRHNINQHTVKNSKSKKMDKEIIQATDATIAVLSNKYPNLKFEWIKTMRLSEIIAMLSKQYPEFTDLFGTPQDTSFISPDGAFLFATNKTDYSRIRSKATRHKGRTTAGRSWHSGKRQRYRKIR